MGLKDKYNALKIQPQPQILRYFANKPLNRMTKNSILALELIPVITQTLYDMYLSLVHVSRALASKEHSHATYNPTNTTNKSIKQVVKFKPITPTCRDLSLSSSKA